MKSVPAWAIALPGFSLGAVAGLVFLMPGWRGALPPLLPFGTPPSIAVAVSSPDHVAWEILPPKRRVKIIKNYRRFSGMTPEEKRFIHDRWQYYRHLPAWRQDQILRDYEAWQRMSPRERLKHPDKRPT